MVRTPPPGPSQCPIESDYPTWAIRAPLPPTRLCRCRQQRSWRKTAEPLRGSLPLFNPTWPNPGSLQPVVQRSRQVNSRLLARPNDSAYWGLLEKVAAARPYRSGGRRKLRSGHLTASCHGQSSSEPRQEKNMEITTGSRACVRPEEWLTCNMAAEMTDRSGMRFFATWFFRA